MIHLNPTAYVKLLCGVRDSFLIVYALKQIPPGQRYTVNDFVTVHIYL